MSSHVGLGRRLRWIAQSLEWRELRLSSGACPFCGPTLFLKLQRDKLGTRCVRCGASPMAIALGRVVRREMPDLARLRVYEASARGPFCEFLRRSAGELHCSELFDDVPPGGMRDGIECQDLQALTYPDAHFDLCTSLEVFEHVPDDRRGFAELLRVLRPGGSTIFSVPLALDAERTVERARVVAGEVVHLVEPPAYHDDLIRGAGRVLVYRDYAPDIVQRLAEVGFERARIVEAGDPSGHGFRLPVVVARKPSAASGMGLD